MINISYFSNKTNPIPSSRTTVSDFYNLVKSGKWAAPIMKCRSLLKETPTPNKLGYDKCKSNLSAVTFAGTFSRRNKDSLLKTSNCVIIDIDKLDLEQLSIIKQQLIADPHTMLVFTSPSGCGLKAVFRAKFTTDQTFKVAWQTISDYLSLTYNIKCDGSGKDICRLCFVSYDPNAYFNADAEYFDVSQHIVTDTKESPHSTIKSIQEPFANLKYGNYVLRVVQKQIDKILRSKEGERNNTLNIASMMIAKFYWTGCLNKEIIQDYLVDAYLSLGGTTKKEAINTFNSGWNKGLTEPQEIISNKERKPICRM